MVIFEIEKFHSCSKWATPADIIMFDKDEGNIKLAIIVLGFLSLINVNFIHKYKVLTSF